MKKSDIGKGRFYSDGKFGVREVVDEGPQYKFYEGVKDDDCLRYRSLNTKPELGIDQERNITRIAFAAWAKQEILPAEVQKHILNIQAEKIAANLTEGQRVFLQSFDDELSESSSVECSRAEYRAAVACHKKGIFATMPKQLKSDEHYFDVKFSPVGLAVLARVIETEQA